ncbi:MAG: tRNA 4-thiouridine(8) synthase ThiI [Clostridiales bacterium]|nr:tRNA 4-thiouridine(8) synthase ThiI [Clostridiales bacterium]
MSTAILIKYAEIHLKGLNRPFFERQLVQKIQSALLPQTPRVEREQGRIFVYDLPESELAWAVDRLSAVFGIHAICPAHMTDKSYPAILAAAEALVETETKGKPHSFKAFAKRSDKNFPMSSEQIYRELGHDLPAKFPHLRVDVHKPELSLTVEVRTHNAFVYTQEIKGAGGMPVGTGGRAMLLLSGGIDSPVAGYMMAKRGVSLAAIHFYSYPYTSERARDKVVALAGILARYAGPVDLYLVPFTEIQMAIYEKCPQTQTTVLMRRLMMRIAERFADKTDCRALVTGESIGQVASQTLESLAVTNDAVKLPVLRPLICFDKEEIIQTAKHIGSFETSILPYEDCCTVFVPKHPVTKPRVDKLRESEARVDFAPLIEAAEAGTVFVRVKSEELW